MEQRKSAIVGLLNLLGGMGGLLSIVLIIWKGGALAQRVDDHSRRLDQIELGGSIGLREHVKMDDERVSDIKQRQVDVTQRLAHQDETLTKLTELFGDVKVINVKLDAINEKIASVTNGKAKQ